MRPPLLITSVVLFLLLGIGSAFMVYDALLRPGPLLIVVDEGGAEVLRLPLRGDPTWEVRWTHSVASIVVRDIYAWRDGRMVLTDSLSPYLDVAGLGHVEGRGDLRDDGDGGAWIADIDEPVQGNAYWLRVGDHPASVVMVHGSRAFDLSRDHAGQRLHIRVENP